ncbi:phosphoglycerate mutase [Marinobacter adhaerens]|jgi:probable phosphoglycerate mutase|uniref:Histidine phosphatase family protein n=1 Tax=Marinobacter adhaerens TaxID=1033846 RepID=A0ABX8IMP4_9GAMM|nr:histidine phosphatase family protein [Marinobacter adhaerens]MCR9190001.1 histidine phosphatase family protein [Alteromonadaceae bacterium]MTI77725.1 histidine phosphatase family protein [Marinobacter sp.]ODM28822.1 phosphoglycerate mutase [Marinobacter adhaerens]QWV14843.1 histidine phosphatase family protein [Marinobacter adhaerens]
MSVNPSKPDGGDRRHLYLVRHGHVNYFDDTGRPLDLRSVRLSVDGEAQVAAIGNLLQGVTFDKAISSDYPRADQTLEMILSDGSVSGPIDSTPALQEVRAGRLSLMPRKAIEAEVSGAYQWSQNKDASFLGGERWEDFSARALEWFQTLLAEPNWQNAVIVSHDAVNRVLISWLVNGDLSSLPFPEQDSACINIVDIDRSQGSHPITAYLRLLNYTPYNPMKSGERLTVMERIAQSMLQMRI